MKIEITEQDIKNGFRDPISERNPTARTKTNTKHFK
jgi:hypothetical protein